ncbi:MAG TPA: MoaD/ThiS family protein [Actinomycetes bacterium]|nr:MoaD/ThiS family protein [Actinomycetes bacterium]
MSVTVRVPTILRQYTGGAAEVSVAGDTLSEVLAALDTAYPGIGPRVLDDAGAIRRFVNVYVDDDDVRFASGLQTPTPEGSSVSIIPAVAGG